MSPECDACDGSGLVYRDNPDRPGYLLSEDCDACLGLGVQHITTDPLCVLHVPPNTPEQRRAFDRQRGLPCSACLNLRAAAGGGAR